jgi:hypothetical protein
MNKRIFLTTYLIASLGLVLYGVLAVVNPEIPYAPFSLHVYQFPTEAGTAIAYIKALFRLLGYLNLIYGGLCLYLLHRYRASQSLWRLMLAPLLGYLGPIIFDNTVGHIGFFEIIEHLLFVVMLLSGGARLVEELQRTHRSEAIAET